MILCDVAREDASVVIGDLRELDIDRDGSIAMEEIDSQISAAALRAEKAAPGALATRWCGRRSSRAPRRTSSCRPASSPSWRWR